MPRIFIYKAYEAPKINFLLLINPGIFHLASTNGMVRHWKNLFPEEKNGTWISNSLIQSKVGCCQGWNFPCKAGNKSTSSATWYFFACNLPWKNSLDSPRMKIHWIQKWIENHISYIWWYKLLSQPHILLGMCQSCWGKSMKWIFTTTYIMYM